MHCSYFFNMGVVYSTPFAPEKEAGDNARKKTDLPCLNTRYFTFTRVNPKASDYDLLVGTCSKVDAYLSYKTVRDGGKVRLFGIIVLRGPSTIADDIGQLFPNFNLTPMVGEFDDNFERLMSSGGGEVIHHNEHPFFGLRRALFCNKV